jgi:pyridoxamine 5'-phosphate oxidase family protein
LKQEYHGRKAAEPGFTEAESEYLSEQTLGRVATSSQAGQPHVVPVVYEFDGRYIYFGGWNLAGSLKYKNITQNSKIAFVVDDLASIRPWAPRGIELRGTAEVLSENGAKCIKITAHSTRSWGLGRD